MTDDPKHAAGAKTLFCEDESLITDDLVRALRNLGYAITVTGVRKPEERDGVLSIAPDELERRVQQETAPLLEAYEQLQQEMAECRKREEELRKSLTEHEQDVARLSESLSEANRHLEPEMVARIKGEEELTRSRNTIEALINAVTESMFVLDNEGIFLALNDTAAERLGKKPSELLGKPIRDYMPPDVYERRRLVHEKVIASGKPYHLEDERQGRNFSNSYYPVFGKDGRVEMVAFCATDITERVNTESKLKRAIEDIERRVEERTTELRLTNEQLKEEVRVRKQAEDEVIKSRERIQAIFETSPAAIFLVSPEGGITVANRRMGDLFSRRGNELLGIPYVQLVHPEERSISQALMKSLMEGEFDCVSLERRYMAGDGREFLGHISGRRLLRPDGGLDGLVGIIEDITERKMAEEALRQSEERFRLVYESNMLGIGFCELDGRVIDANDAYLSMIRRSRDDLTNGRINWQEITPAEHLPSDFHGFEELIAKGRCKPYEKEYLLDDGTRVPVIIGGALLSGSSSTAIAFALDITDRKKAEQQIKNSLEEKESLLREIHHRVKNNLAVISSLLGLQSRHARDAYHRRMFVEAQDRIRSMALVHEKLYQAENLADVDAKEYLLSLVEYLFTSKGRIGSALQLRDELCAVRLDPETAVNLGFIVNELVTNCIKHAFPQGPPGRVLLGLQRVGEFTLELRVADDGIGLLEDIDIEAPRSLGLDLVRIFSRQLRGRLDVKRDHGTDFRLSFDYGKRR